MKELDSLLKNKQIVYVTRDPERACSFKHKGYFIITNNSPFAQRLAEKNKNIIIISETRILDTHELLNHPRTKELLRTLKDPHVLVFKNTTHIESLCKLHNWKLLNPSAALSSVVEEKISGVSWLGELKKYLPPHKILTGKELEWKGKNFIIQFNRAHTGTGTILIASENQLREIKNKFPDRPMRVTEYISGPAFTGNNIIWGEKILVGQLNYQITGLRPFTSNQFATVGNDWKLPKIILNDEQLKTYLEITEKIGKKLSAAGWKGLFGLDLVLEEKTGKVFLIEINARQPASTTYESELQKKNVADDLTTTFEAHLSALMDIPKKKYELAAVAEGAQIIKRIADDTPPANVDEKKLKELKLNVIKYENTEPGQDFLRIQSKNSIMFAHNEFSDLGKKIQNLLS